MKPILQLASCSILRVVWLAMLMAAFGDSAFGIFQEPGLQEGERIEIMGTTMGPIPYRVIVVKDAQTPDEQSLGDSVQAKLDQIDSLMSTYKPDSDISKFNRSNSTDWVVVHPHTVKVVARANEISKTTGGAFDITVGPVVKLWRFGPDKDKKFRVPNEMEIDKVKASVGWEKLTTRLEPPSLKKSVPTVQIDLSAIAKGYAVDEVARLLASLDCNNALIEVGGEVYGMGRSGPGRRWRVGVERPNPGPGREIEQVAELEDAAMATSGDYRNFNVVEGVRYSHSIDPKTCRPVKNNLATACVVARDCMTADAFATAVMVMGPVKGWDLCLDMKMPLMIMERKSNEPFEPNSFETRVSANFPIVPELPKPVEKVGILPVFIAATIVFALAILGMAAGAIFGRKPLQGSCGGLSSTDGAAEGSSCSLCQNPKTECVESNRQN